MATTYVIWICVLAIITNTNGLSTNLAESVAFGAAMGIDHCQKLFKWDKWNCPESTFSRSIDHPANKELAFARAIVAAGVVHTITKNCSRGQIEDCGCNNANISNALFLNDGQNKTTQEIDGGDWSWGCPDHLEYGDKVAKSFLDDLENKNDSRSIVHLHNNLIGREIVKETMVRKCVCHGMSGSCALQTCWLQVAPFPLIAAKLKERFKQALHIQEAAAELESNVISKSIPERIQETNKLVFLENSPDYCLANEATNWNGTKGRTCSRSKLETASKAEKRSCRNVCRSCGHRVKKQKRRIETKCECEFHWCCEVKCNTCVEVVEEFYCQPI